MHLRTRTVRSPPSAAPNCLCHETREWRSAQPRTRAVRIACDLRATNVRILCDSRRGRVLIRRADLAAYIANCRQGATRAPVRLDVDTIATKVRKRTGT